MYRTATEDDLKVMAERLLAPILKDVRAKLNEMEEGYDLLARDAVRLKSKLIATNERYNKQVKRVVAVRKEILTAIARLESGK